jgi:hypothetical protein
MKNLIIVTMFLFMGVPSLISSENNGDKPLEIRKEMSVKSGGYSVHIEITIGRRSKDCRGYSLCSARTVEDAVNAPLIGYQNMDGNLLTLEIPADYIKTTQPEKLNYFTNQSQFVMEESYTLPTEVSAKLGSKQSLTIKAGSYPMTFKNNVYTIVIEDLQ